MKVIDLTHIMEPGMPVYPGTEPPTFAPGSTYERDGFKETRLALFTHTGTHMDPPSHLFAGRTTIDRFPASQFIGKALVIDCKAARAGDAITMAYLGPYGEALCNVDFLLFNTGWDKFWGTPEYFGDYPCIDFEVLQFVIDGNYKGIGFDYIGLDPIDDADLPRHKMLFLETDIVNLENLANLDQCGSKPFNFSCFPLRIADGDGSPIRAVAWWD